MPSSGRGIPSTSCPGCWQLIAYSWAAGQCPQLKRIISLMSLSEGQPTFSFWSTERQKRGSMPQFGTTQKGHPSSKFPVGWIEAFAVTAATSPSAHPASSLPYKCCPREHSPETICLCCKPPTQSRFPGKLYMSKTGCMYACLFLNKSKINTYVSTK